jgi:hypothetical protein
MRSKSIFVLVFLAGLAGSVYAGTYSGGTGEPNNPYRIATPNDLNDIGNHVEDFNKCFIMVNDINLADYNGTRFNIIGSSSDHFVGVFDGNGHTISNFTWDSTGIDAIGIFAYVGSPGEIKNVGLIDPNVDAGTGDRVGALVGALDNGTISGCAVQGGSVSGRNYIGGLIGDTGWESPLFIINCSADSNITATGVFVGGLMGYCSNGMISGCIGAGDTEGSKWVGGLVGVNDGGQISGCYATGSVWCDDNFAGGLVGRSNNANISHCYASGTVRGALGASIIGGLVGHIDTGTVVECYATGDVGGLHTIGGLAGYHKGGGITSCYASGSVSGDHWTGGLVGTNSGNVKNCYAAGIVDGNNTAGLIGLDLLSIYTKCFWDCSVNADVNGIGNRTDPNVIGKTTAEMQVESTFTDAGWDFVEVWDIGENQTYPFLRIYPVGDLNHDGLVNFADVAILALHWLEGTER